MTQRAAAQQQQALVPVKLDMRWQKQRILEHFCWGVSPALGPGGAATGGTGEAAEAAALARTLCKEQTISDDGFCETVAKEILRQVEEFRQAELQWAEQRRQQQLEGSQQLEAIK